MQKKRKGAYHHDVNDDDVRWSTRAFHLNKMMAHLHGRNEIKMVATTELFHVQSYFVNQDEGKKKIR